MHNYIDIVFDGPPGHESGRFIEVENSKGSSIKFGEWIRRRDGYWVIRLRVGNIENAAKALVDKLRVIENSDAYKRIWPFLYTHGCSYDGPNYKQEIDDLERTLNV